MQTSVPPQAEKAGKQRRRRCTPVLEGAERSHAGALLAVSPKLPETLKIGGGRRGRWLSWQKLVDSKLALPSQPSCRESEATPAERLGDKATVRSQPSDSPLSSPQEYAQWADSRRGGALLSPRRRCGRAPRRAGLSSPLRTCSQRKQNVTEAGVYHAQT